ncbi:hypothetical protein GCM10007981_18800 [Thermocladium modestius]|uniref:Type II secretion system protein GspF domain-containing protein n=1 Tax=Thermocladium modestius TaxID=62609 RepID=A0A830GWU7_9CREN|nr:type II secretion system F family protein [Thermocladium modestius]GGP22497.1 hypothetical protein GCM10007981_18800 [Thermocladium modestius]
MRWINHAAFAALLAASLLSLALSPSSLTTVEVGGEFQLPVPSSRLAVSAFSALLSLALLVEGLPRYRRSAFIARVEGQVPEMVKSFQSAFSTGLTMADAARMVAESGLSPINGIFRQALANYRLTGDLPASLFRAVAGSGSRKAVSALKVIMAAYQHGAGAEEALEALYRSLSQLREFESQKRSHLGQYTAIIYVMVPIFSLVASIVVVGFIPQLQSLKASSSPFAEGIGGGGGIGISVPTGLSIIQLTSSVISLFAGAIIGRLVYGDPWAGLIHSSALVAISLAVYLAAPLASGMFT